MVEEDNNREVLDSACSQTVVRKEKIERFIHPPPESAQEGIKVEESETLYGFEKEKEGNR